MFNKNNSQALYVGRTKNLRQRLYYNHLQGNKPTARLKK
ncbi:GIY-YIG nuclease family protein [Ornithinibacillus salinisoli]|uniref:GIY-YIG nuclease family protein n=1 Tax=Ornithinibacillus salinisoli TaxID=1848459 RepID=A0ABW4W583_9BACI